MNPGPNAIAQTGLGGYRVTANPNDYVPKVGGVTIDWSTVTAEAASRELPGGVDTVVGDKVIPAGSILYKLGNGKYGVAIDTTTLVRGEAYILDRHVYQSIDAEQVGDVFDTGTAFYGRLLIGGASQPTANNFLAAFPRVSLVRV
jgi:hypothetical protein